MMLKLQQIKYTYNENTKLSIKKAKEIYQAAFINPL